MNWQKEFEVYAAKGPVNVPGAQRRADRAVRAFWDMLIADEKSALLVARSHARLGEGREEFDKVIVRVRARLKRDAVSG